jgi:hypothetical protein
MLSNSMTQDQTYFFWGCGESIQYGLYSPVMDRLVCVDSDYTVFEYIVFLMSSKIRLLIVPLHHAPNFSVDLIDNTCCTQWTITNWPEQSLDRKFSFPQKKETFFFDTCGDLIQKSNKNLVEIQNFIFLSYRVLKLFKFSKNYQKQVVITMYNRAKYHPHRTNAMLEAMKIFEKWMHKNNTKIIKNKNKSQK